MIRFLLPTLAFLLLTIGCKQDTSQMEEDTSSVATQKEKADTASKLQINGFNFLTACDSLVVSKLVLADPNDGADYAYVMGQCATGKSYELLLVPRTGATPADQFGDPTKVLAEAEKNNFANYICYALEMPKHLKVDATGAGEIANLYPINAVVKRLDNNDWVRLGQDRAEDLAAYNTLRWNILHDKMPQYD